MKPMTEDLIFTGPEAITDRVIGTYADYGKDISPRELEVLELKVAGMTSAMIAAELGISEQTVKNHISALLAKTGAPNTLALATRYGRWQGGNGPWQAIEALEHRVAMLETGGVSVLGHVSSSSVE